jgi:endogenous inhibitor of DNA gyrase (YacG/DUF329 family)
VSDTRPDERTRVPRCPICGRPRVHQYRPFCSARCRDVDLARWFNEAYVVPAAAPGDEGEGEGDGEGDNEEKG